MKPPPISPEFKRKLERHAGEGLSNNLSDNAFWLPDEFDDGLLDGLDMLDKSNGRDKTLLIAALKRSDRLSDHWLADLLERYNLQRKSGGGRRRMPAYNLTDVHARLVLAKMQVINGGVSREQAAAAHRVDKDLLNAYLNGKRTDLKRIEKRGRTAGTRPPKA